MATQQVTYRTNSLLSCATCLPASVTLCLTSDDIVLPLNCPDEETAQDFLRSTISASITAVVQWGTGCGVNGGYEYTIEYDDALISVPLIFTADIAGVTCDGCLKTYIDEAVGNEINVVDNMDGTSSLFSQHGCEFTFVSGGELSDLIVADTNSVDLTLAGVSPKTLTADVIIDPDPSNGISITANGLFAATGWSIIGNAGTIAGTNFLGTTDNVVMEIRANNLRAFQIIPATTSPHILMGSESNGIVTGIGIDGNTVGGGGNAAFPNQILFGAYHTISGGRGNTINFSNDYGFIGGGSQNTVGQGSASAVVAGQSNSAQGAFSFIGGGTGNVITYASTTLSEGVICGGKNNTLTTSRYSIIGGGESNLVISATHSAVLCGRANGVGANSSYSFIGGGEQNGLGDVVVHSVIAGGRGNAITADAEGCFIGGGRNNSIFETALHCFIGGGFENEISTTSEYSVIVGGNNNGISDPGLYSFIGGGLTNSIGETNTGCVIVGGQGNSIAATSTYCVVVGGASCNIAFTGDGSSILGGLANNIGNTSEVCVIAGGTANTIDNQSIRCGILAGTTNTIGVDCDQCSIVGGVSNIIETTANGCCIVGGALNTIDAATTYSTIAGGQQLIIGNRSLGFNAGTILADVSTETDLVYFGNCNLWLSNTNTAGTQSELRLYELATVDGTIPEFYNAIRTHASSMTQNIRYTLPFDTPAPGDRLTVTSVTVAGSLTSVQLEWAP